MINTKKDRMNKLSWLDDHFNIQSFSDLKIQKFLFFYELFVKYKNEKVADFSSLKAYPKGPVFSQTYGDLKYNRYEFLSQIKHNITVNEKIDSQSANNAVALVKSLSDNELSDLTHQFHLWKSKEERLNNGEQQITIEEKDISLDDLTLAANLYAIYDHIQPSEHDFIEIGNKIFILTKEDSVQLTSEHKDILKNLSTQQELVNPVFVEVEEGVLIVD